MSDEHTVAIVSFEGAIKREIKKVREQLKRVDGLNSFIFTVRSEGRVLDGDIKLAFKISKEYGSDEVEGARLSPVLDEFMRRQGWKKVNAPLSIGYEKIPGDDTNEETTQPKKDDDEIPL